MHWKRGGTWSALKGGCARDIAFGGDGSLFKVSCRKDGFQVYAYDLATEDWTKIEAPRAWSITADAAGNPSISDYYANAVLRYSFRTGSWTDTGLKDAHYIDHGYALSAPKKGSDFSIHKWGALEKSWVKLPQQKAWTIAAQEQSSRVFIT